MGRDKSALSERLRVFIGVPPKPPLLSALRHKLLPIQAELPAGAVRWLSPDNIHLTLQFIGMLERDRIADIEQVLRALAATTQPFELPLYAIDAFPDAKSVVVAALGEATVPMQRLVTVLADGLACQGVVADGRRYRPHLTLGRIKRRPLPPLEQALELAFPVDRLVLYQSTTAASGAVYSRLAEYPFAG